MISRLMIIGLIFAILGMIGFCGFIISLPICIALNQTEKPRRPESYIMKINAIEFRINTTKDRLTAFQIERLKLDLLKFYWQWIVAANKFGYTIPPNFQI